MVLHQPIARLLLNQIKGVIARDLVGYEGLIKILNQEDKTVAEALRLLEQGQSPVNIKPSKKR